MILISRTNLVYGIIPHYNYITLSNIILFGDIGSNSIIYARKVIGIYFTEKIEIQHEEFKELLKLLKNI